jgi:Glyoxalase-like domain
VLASTCVADEVQNVSGRGADSRLHQTVVHPQISSTCQARVLMRPVDDGATDAFATIGFHDDGPTRMFLQPPGELPTVDNRLMLDLSGEEDWAEQADRVQALGAQRISDNEQDGIKWVVFAIRRQHVPDLRPRPQ